MALLDDHLDERERAFVDTFARNWGIDFQWDSIAEAVVGEAIDFLPLRRDLQEYLTTSPPAAQVKQLSEVLHALIDIDQTVTQQESLMMTEIDGMIDVYLTGIDAAGRMYAVVLVPQGAEQDQAIAQVLPDLHKRELHGGQVYVAGTYHSFDFAEIVSAQYRALNFFAAVVRITEEHSERIS